MTYTTKHDPFSKTRINEETTVNHISRNNYSYRFNAGNGKEFAKTGLDYEVILTEESSIGPESWIIGYVKNKQEFVDLVYENLH